MMKLENWLAFAGGVVVGGAMLMILAPKSRKEMCANVKKRMEDAKEYMSDAMNRCHAHPCDCTSNNAEKNEPASLEE